MGGMRWDDWDVFVMKADGTNVRKVTSQNYYFLNRPVFTRGSKSVVFCADPQGTANLPSIFEVDLSGDKPPKLLSGTTTNRKGDVYAFEPAISPEGRHIAYISDSGQ